MPARTLLDKWLDYWDPLLFGLSSMGVACGVDLMAGMGGWVAVNGLHVLFIGEHADSVDETRPVGVAGHTATSITPFGWFAHDPDQTLIYELMAIGGGGVMAAEAPQIAVQADGAGDAIAPSPAAPRDVSAAPAAGGVIVVRWRSVAEPGRPAPSTFRIYGDSGSGTMDWVTPIGQVTAGQPGYYSWASSGFAHGTSTQWGVRARSAAGQEDDNAVVATAVAVVDHPPAASVLTAVAGDDE